MIANAVGSIARMPRAVRACVCGGGTVVLSLVGVLVPSSRVAVAAVGPQVATSASAAAPPSASSDATIVGTAATSASAVGGAEAAPADARPSLYGTTDGADTRLGLDPFPSSGRYLAYGLSLDIETLLGAGQICPSFASEGCVIGGGAGLVASGAYRTPRASLGVAYSATFHDSHSIYQRGVLMQLRGEYKVRPRELALGDSIAGYGGLGVGIATYGDNWAIATEAATAHLLAGAEIDLSVKLALVIGFAYRALYFRRFTDASGQERPAGLVQMLGIELGLELHDPL